jgi:hypothetical protein
MRRSFRVCDAAPCGHPVDLAGAYRLNDSEAVAVHEFALEEIGYGGESDVRVRRYIKAAASPQHLRTHLVQEDERTNHAPFGRRKGAPDLKLINNLTHTRDDDHFESAWYFFLFALTSHSSSLSSRGNHETKARPEIRIIIKNKKDEAFITRRFHPQHRIT